MNLKEAFRFQNKLQSMMADAQSILGNNGNITKVQNTYLRHKVMAEAEDEVTMKAPSTEYSESITEMAEFLLFLLDEREKLSAAIHQAKVSLPLGAGLDGEVSLNGKRQEIATLLRHMVGLRNGEVLISTSQLSIQRITLQTSSLSSIRSEFGLALSSCARMLPIPQYESKLSP